MKRTYIIEKRGLAFLSNVEIKRAPKHLDFVVVLLTDAQAEILVRKGIRITQEIEQKGGSHAADPDYERKRSMVPRWGIKGYYGAGSKVAVLGTGLKDFIPRFAAFNMVEGGSVVSGGSGHETAVCSIIVGSDNYGMDTIGIAPQCELHFLKIFNDNNVLIEGAALDAIDYCIENQIDFVNMSFGFTSVAFDAAIAALIASGAVVIASAGNSATPAYIEYPAALPGVVAVTVRNQDGFFPLQSVNIPPGGTHGITVACNGSNCQIVGLLETLGTSNGTSYAAPFFTGMLAVWKQILRTTDNYQVLKHGLANCLDAPDVTWKVTGA